MEVNNIEQVVKDQVQEVTSAASSVVEASTKSNYSLAVVSAGAFAAFLLGALVGYLL